MFAVNLTFLRGAVLCTVVVLIKHLVVWTEAHTMVIEAATAGRPITRALIFIDTDGTTDTRLQIAGVDPGIWSEKHKES